MNHSTIGKAKAGSLETDKLFMGAVAVVNKAIALDEEAASSSKSDSLAERLASDKEFGFAVFEVDPTDTRGCYSLRFSGHALEAAVLNEEGANISCRIPRDHLRVVCDNPEEYIEHPENIELFWLLDRLAV